MTDTMIERVARAIYELRTAKYGGLWPADSLSRLPWEQQATAIRENYLDEARAAIAAMREPDDKMQQAMALDQDQWAETHQTDVWRAMIDAALKEGQE